MDPSQAVEKRIALVIGNNAYDSLERLKNPVSDAKVSSLEYARVGWIFAGIRFVISRSPVRLRRVVPIFQPLTILSVKKRAYPIGAVLEVN